MIKEEISLKADIDRLVSLQHSDPGFFLLAVYSFIEGYLRKRYELPYEQAAFTVLVAMLRDELKAKQWVSDRDFSYLHNLGSGIKIANGVRHAFSAVSGDELIASVYSLKRFAQLNDFYADSKLVQLEDRFEPWETRKTNTELSRELQQAADRIAQLSADNSNLSGQIAELGILKDQLMHLERSRSSITAELESLRNKTKSRDEKHDALRREKFAEQEAVRKEIGVLQNKIGEMADARNFIEALTRITVYTRTRLDFEQSLIRLTAEQTRILEQIKLKKDFLVKGSAGTGKSLVLVKAMEKALGSDSGTLGLEEKATVALLTYTKSLVAYTAYVSSLLDMPVPADFISTVDKFFQHRFRALENAGEVVYNSETILSFFKTQTAEGMTAKDLYNEAENFIWANMVTEEEYVDGVIPRTGMKKAIKGNQRKQVWDAVESAAARMRADGKWTRALAAAHVVGNAARLPDAELVDYIFIDEVQDLPAVVLAAVKKCSRRAVILAGDADQSIYQSGFSWKRAGFDIGGRTRILHTNFRNTVQLHDFAEKYRKTIPGMDSENTSEAFRFGAPPECTRGKTVDDLYEQILAKVTVCLKYLEYDPENICIIAPTKEHLQRLGDDLKNRLDIASAVINQDSFSFADKGVVRLSTMHSSKGLDFPVVLFLLDHRPHFQGAFDDETQDRMVRNLIYVSITRAMEQLHVFTLEGSTAAPIIDLVR